MKRLALFLPLVLSGFATSVQAATVYDFAAQGNHVENAYAAFDTNPLVNADSIQPDGIVISASNGGGLPSVPGFVTASSSPAYAYMDGHWKQDAGLGVCQSLTNSCGSDDNQMQGEFIHMVFDTLVEILALDITGNHEAVSQGTELWYSLDGGTSWAMEDIGGQVIGPALDLNVSWFTNTLDYTIKAGPGGGEMYLAGMTVNPVPVPAAFWLFGSALFGFIAVSRRTKV